MNSSSSMLEPRSRPLAPAFGEQKKQPVLAWWAIFPVIALIALNAVFGYPAAKLDGKTPELAVAFTVGSVIGSLVVSLLIAWIAYAIGGKSQLAGTITFSVLIGCGCLGVVGQAKALRLQLPGLDQGAIDTPAADSATPGRESFGSFGFDLPEGWKRVPPDNKTAVAMLLLDGPTWKTARGMLKVNVGSPTRPSARQMAEVLAGKDGQVSSAPVVIDGVEGVRAELPSTDMSRPRHAVVVFHNRKAYLIMAAAAKGADVTAAFDEVLKSWRWHDKS